MKKKEEKPGRRLSRRTLKLILPVYCDFSCPQASFAPPDAVGACRRDQAVYCALLDTYNMKNALCIVRKYGRLKNRARRGTRIRE